MNILNYYIISPTYRYAIVQWEKTRWSKVKALPWINTWTSVHQEIGGISGLVVRALTQIVRGMGLSPTWSHTFPGIPDVSIDKLFIYFIRLNIIEN